MNTTGRWIPPLAAGRRPAGRALLALLDDPRAPRTCRVTGPAGIGKTRLLTWLATACSDPATPARQRPDAAVSLAGTTVHSATWTIAARLGVWARTPAELVAGLRAADRPRLLILWDLNRSAEPEAVAGLLLGPLSDLPGVRMVVESDGVLPVADEPAVLALDEPRWTDAGRFASWYDRQRAGSPFTAEQVYPSPGLALLAARVPAGAANPADGPDGPAGADVPAAWWAAVPDEVRPAFGALTTAVRPLTRQEWSVLAGPEAVGRAAELLPPDSPSGDTWWLPAGPLRQVVTDGTAPVDPADVARALAGTVPRTADRGPDLLSADPGLLGLLLGQCVAAGMADQLLEDPLFVACAEPLAVAAAFGSVGGGRLHAAWHAAGPALLGERSGPVRAEMLRARLAADGTEHGLPPVPGAPWHVEWSCGPAQAEAPFVAAALGRGPFDGRILAADDTGSVHLVDLATGRLLDRGVLVGPEGLTALTCYPDGTVAALGPDGEVQLLAGDLRLPSSVAGRPTALAHLPAVGDDTGTVHWPVSGGTSAERLHQGAVTALGAALLPPDHDGVRAPLLVSGGADGRVRAWRPGQPALESAVTERGHRVTAVSVAAGPAGLFLAAAWADGLVRFGPVDPARRGVEFALGAVVRTLLLPGPDHLVCLSPEGLTRIFLAPAAVV
ncbi:hypothetical protein ACFVHB_38005 [Kitasatospora sp. NPDC127111]|uniref:WD40 repeat domain-containing protein n=1 Tax=Kitasatospora sp. NPDC127111 TaxID=3345363 RepID=UPI003635B9E1